MAAIRCFKAFRPRPEDMTDSTNETYPTQMVVLDATDALPSGVFATAPRREREIISIAFKWNISVISQAPLVIYPSIAWVRASIPVEAVRPFGMLDIISGSMTATTGIS